MHKYPTSFQATDAVIVNREKGLLLLGRKPSQAKFRFVGGFVDPAKDKCLEDGCKRETAEEAGIDLECSGPKYLFSYQVEDARYVDSPDKIMTAVFLRYYIFGRAVAGDDIGEVKWFTKNQLRTKYKSLVMPEHWPIVEGLIQRNVI